MTTIIITYKSKRFYELCRKYDFYPITRLNGEIWLRADTGSTAYLCKYEY